MTLPLCVRIDADDKRSSYELEQDGWREVEVLETWRIATPYSGYVGQGIEPAKQSDNLTCQRIAQQAFQYDRLHADPVVSEDDADDAKRAWVNSAFRDNLQNILVHRQGDVDGFLIVKPETAILIIDLIAIDPAYQGRGIAKSLIRAAHAMHPNHQALQAGTQERNEAGRRLYSSLGFVVVKRQRTFHKTVAA
jgi:ribosomal protein S18 acetylase RimI-like enzyme